MRRIWMFGVVVMVSAVAEAAIYRWQDADGTQHFGDAAQAPASASVLEGLDGNWMPMKPSGRLPPIQIPALSGEEHPQLKERRLRKERCQKLRSEAPRKGEQRRRQHERYDKECVLPERW